MNLPSLSLEEINVTDLEVFANPADIRFDLHTFVEYAWSHEIKRGHRDNRVPAGHQQRLAKLLSHPANEADMDEDKCFPWIEHVVGDSHQPLHLTGRFLQRTTSSFQSASAPSSAEQHPRGVSIP